MVFSSIIFIFAFLPSVLLVYYLSPKPLKNLVLLLFSLLFYYWGARGHFYLLLVSIFLNYLSGLLLGLIRNEVQKRIVLTLSVVTNLSLLLTFKYADFFIENINKAFSQSIPALELVLPIGISFFTFQGLSYTIDVYTGKTKANYNPFQIALYISLFPQLVAGPIVKYNEINDQIRRRGVTPGLFSSGIDRFVVGLSKKVLIANVLGETADSIFNLVKTSGVDAPTAWLGIFCYSMQIYYDFSGYSDMAIGLGRMFGFHFLENFNYPYISTSITEFWRRWHISLSTWFRDYLYIPLGGNRRGIVSLNLFLVFLATGLWHGASWNFVIWGLWHGIFLILEKRFFKMSWYKKIPGILRFGATMFVVLLGWILFRSPDLPSTLDYLKIMFGFTGFTHLTFTFPFFLDPRIAFTILLSILAAGPYLTGWMKRFEDKPAAALLKTFAIAGLFVVCVTYIVNGVYNPFIYFRF